MNIKKLLGFACWLLAFIVPAHYALLNSEYTSNTHGLIAFLCFVFLVFFGYWLVDSSSARSADHGH